MKWFGLLIAMSMGLSAVGAGCGPQLEYGPDHPCWLEGGVSGAVERDLSWTGREHGCAGAGSEVTPTWGTSVPDFQYDLQLPEDFEPGTLGEVPAKVRIYVGDGEIGTPQKRSWATEMGDCTATLTKWLGSKNPNISASLKTYHVRGNLACSAPAEARYDFQEPSQVAIENAEFQAFWGKASVAVVKRNQPESRQ